MNKTCKKYELTGETVEHAGRTLHRIRALIDFTTADGVKIHAGDLGGYVEKYKNLSQNGNAWVDGNARVYGNAWVGGDAHVFGNARVGGDARVGGNSHMLTISNIGSRGGTTTFFRGSDNKIHVNCGCFNGTIDEFANAVDETHGDNKHGQTYRKSIEIAKLHIELDMGANKK